MRPGENLTLASRSPPSGFTQDVPDCLSEERDNTCEMLQGSLEILLWVSTRAGHIAPVWHGTYKHLILSEGKQVFSKTTLFLQCRPSELFLA